MSDTTATVKNGGSFKSGMALLCSLLSLTATGYLYYYNLELQQRLQVNLTQATTEYKEQLQAYNIRLQHIKESNQEMSASVNALADMITNKTAVAVYQINELVNLANQSLLVYANLNGAIKLLTYAQDILNYENGAAFTQLKLSLSSDLQKLNQVPVLNTIWLVSELNSILFEIDKLSLIKPAKLPITSSYAKEKQTTTNDSNIWHRFLENIKSSLMGLFSVSKSGGGSSILLLPENNSFIRQQIKLDLLNAKIALLEHNNDAWQLSLQESIKTLQLYFKIIDGSQAIIARLEQMQRTQIDFTKVNIDDTLKALSKTNELVNLH